MATATGEFTLDFSGLANTNDYDNPDFAERNGMTAIISSESLRSNFNVDAYYSYTAVLPNQSSFEVKGETLQSSSQFGDQVGVGAINTSGNGYLYWINGNQHRIYKVNAFVLEQLGNTENLTHASLAVVSLLYEFSAGTVTLTAKINGVDQILVREDSTSPYNGDLEATWYFNHDNSNLGGFRSIAADGISSVSIVSINSGNGVRAGSVGNTLVTSGDFTPTSGTIAGIAVTSLSGTYPNFTFSMPAVIDETVHPFYGDKQAVFTDGSDSPELTTPYLPKAGYDYVTLSGVLDTTINGVIYEFIPEAEVGDQIAFPSPEVEITSNGSGSTIESGTFELEHISQSDNTLRFFDLIVGELEEDDTTPDAFTFLAVNNVELSTVTESNSISVLGVTDGIDIPISITGGEYQVNSGSWVSTSGNVQLNASVKVRATSSSNYSSTTQTVITIGGVQSIFSVTTKAETPTLMDSEITIAGGLASKISIAAQVNSRAKLSYIADSTAANITDFVTDLNELLAAMRTANWFEEEEV